MNTSIVSSLSDSHTDHYLPGRKELEQHVRFNLRWKHALGMGPADEGFDVTVLCRFRRKLVDCGLEHALFERLANAAREAELLTKDAAQLLDSRATSSGRREPETPIHTHPQTA